MASGLNASIAATATAGVAWDRRLRPKARRQRLCRHRRMVHVRRWPRPPDVAAATAASSLPPEQLPAAASSSVDASSVAFAASNNAPNTVPDTSSASQAAVSTVGGVAASAPPASDCCADVTVVTAACTGCIVIRITGQVGGGCRIECVWRLAAAATGSRSLAPLLQPRQEGRSQSQRV